MAIYVRAGLDARGLCRSGLSVVGLFRGPLSRPFFCSFLLEPRLNIFFLKTHGSTGSRRAKGFLLGRGVMLYYRAGVETQTPIRPDPTHRHPRFWFSGFKISVSRYFRAGVETQTPIRLDPIHRHPRSWFSEFKTSESRLFRRHWALRGALVARLPPC